MKHVRRVKRKGKEWLHLTSRDASPSSSGRNTPDVTSPNAQTGSAHTLTATQNITNAASSPDANTHISTSAPEVNTGSGKDSMMWSGVKTLLAVLESSADAFGPLKEAVGSLNKCISIYESALKERRDYAELHEKLDTILGDLAGYLKQPIGTEMTNAVNHLGRDIDAELEKVVNKEAQNRAKQLATALDASGEILECYRRIHGHLERLNRNASMHNVMTLNKLATLTGMSAVKSAFYNSAESDGLGRGKCAPGTREPQIELLLEWALHPEKGRICWINGMAGTGKTTIAYSVCSQLEEAGKLAASFFCSRTIPECRQIKCIIPSLAYQLARFSPPFQCALVKALESDPDAHARELQIQYKKLIVEPLLGVQRTPSADFIMVIDALDECENENSVGQILELFLSTPSTLPMRYLVSSRPEKEIYEQMVARGNEEGDVRLVLHDLDKKEVQLDIGVYMRRQLEGINLTEAQWSRLIERCGVLFIYASTTCKYIKQAHEEEMQDEAVSAVLDSSVTPMGEGDESVIDGLYSTILAAAFDISRRSEASRTKTKNILETVVCAQVPMSLGTIAGLLRLGSAKQVEALLKPLRSVINVAEGTGLVTTLHASFAEFMFSSHRSASFCCIQVARHYSLAEGCLRMIDSVESKFNICGLTSSCVLDVEVEDLEERVRCSISPGLVYACRHWSTHLHLGGLRGELVDVVRGFFSSKLLIWMEILNLTKNIRFGTGVIREAESWCDKSAVSEELQKMAQDAREFVSVYANHPISQSTPHIYISMLPFWPRSQPVSVAYMPRTSGPVKPDGTAIEQQRSALLATWKVSNHVIYSMSLSADGARIFSTDGIASFLIDTSTGNTVLTLDEEYFRGVKHTALSPDGTRVAWCRAGGVYLMNLDASTTNTPQLISNDASEHSRVVFSHDGLSVAFTSGSLQSAYIYRIQHGEPVLYPTEEHANGIYALAFCPEGLHLATGSEDKTIRIWETRSGHLVGKPLEGHDDVVLSVAYSPDGSHLASVSYDDIRIWDIETRETVLGPLKRHSDMVSSVVFSPNGAYIASGSDDRTIRVYDARTGQTVLGPLMGHTHWVLDVIFSPDSAQLFSSSWDGTVRVWSVRNSDIPSGLRQSLPVDLSYARHSIDGSRAVSGTLSGMVYVWDVRAGRMVLGPLEGHTDYITAVDYSPDGAYIASASSDHTLRIWDTLDGRDLHGPIRGHTGSIRCVRFSPDSSLVASASIDRTVRLWDVQGGDLVKLLEGHSSVAFSPNGSQVVSGSEDRTLRVWDTNSGETVTEPLQCSVNERISSVEFSPDGSCILSAAYDGPLRIWDPQTGQTSIIGDSLHIYSAAFSPDGHLVVFGGARDKGIRVWDVQSRQMILGPLFGHIDDINSVQFSPDGSHVMSSSYDGAIRFWDVSSRRSDPQYKKEQGDSDSSMGDTSDPWSLDKDGWVVDRQKQKLVWVPVDLRICFLRHPNDSIVCHRGSLRLNFDGANIGESWTRCYVP